MNQVEFAGQPYIWQQDLAPLHKAKTMQQQCAANFHSFWPAEIWPPNSTDLNPLDYGILGIIEKKACWTNHTSVAAMKASVEQEWAAMDEDFIKRTCAAFRPRHEAMLAMDGGHLEK